MKEKNVVKDIIILLIAVTALVIAALNPHASLNMLVSKEDE